MEKLLLLLLVVTTYAKGQSKDSLSGLKPTKLLVYQECKTTEYDLTTKWDSCHEIASLFIDSIKIGKSIFLILDQKIFDVDTAGVYMFRYQAHDQYGLDCVVAMALFSNPHKNHLMTIFVEYPDISYGYRLGLTDEEQNEKDSILNKVLNDSTTN